MYMEIYGNYPGPKMFGRNGGGGGGWKTLEKIDIVRDSKILLQIYHDNLRTSAKKGHFVKNKRTIRKLR